MDRTQKELKMLRDNLKKKSLFELLLFAQRLACSACYENKCGDIEGLQEIENELKRRGAK